MAAGASTSSAGYRIARLEFVVRMLVAWLDEGGQIDSDKADELKQMLSAAEPAYFLPVKEHKV